MHQLFFRRWTAALTSLFYLIACSLCNVQIAHSQTLDSDPPVIELEVVESGIAGETQVFLATVTDNSEISSVTLHHRFDTESQYTSSAMMVIESTSIFTASVNTDEASGRTIQYYVEARDSGGNRAVEGFAFDPLERQLELSDVPIQPVAETQPASEPLPLSRKILYGLLGVVVVGALASSGGSSGGSASGSPGREIDLTVLVDPVPQ